MIEGDQVSTEGAISEARWAGEGDYGEQVSDARVVKGQ